MRKKLISYFKSRLIFLSGILMGAGFMLALEVNTSIPSLTAYLRQLILTSDGTPSGTKTIVIDGAVGNGDFLGDVRVRGALNIDLGAISDGTIIGADIKDGSIGSVDIAPNSISRAHLDSTIRAKIDNGLLYPTSSASSPFLGVYGQCGSANGGSYTTQPTTNLCSVGTVSWVDALASDGSWNWLCLGSNGGADASCSALVKIDGKCGSADGSVYTTQPTTNLCSVGTVYWTDPVGLDGDRNRRCLGVNGGNTASCSALRINVGGGGDITSPVWTGGF